MKKRQQRNNRNFATPPPRLCTHLCTNRYCFGYKHPPRNHFIRGLHYSIFVSTGTSTFVYWQNTPIYIDHKTMTNARQWGARLTDHFQRCADVTLRGYSGYNTRWARHLIPHVFPSAPNARKPALVTVFFGANDAARPGPLRGQGPDASRQTVPLEVSAYGARPSPGYMYMFHPYDTRIGFAPR